MDDRPLSADRVPTLTEVVELDLPLTPAVAEPVGPVDAAEAVTLDIGPPLVVEAQEAAVPDAVDVEPAAIVISEAIALPEEQAAEVPCSVPESEAGQEPGHEPLPPRATEPIVEPIVEARAAPDTETVAAVESSLAVVPAPPAAPIDTDALVAQVLAELQPRVDMLLESRLREALAPALARVADGLIRDTRDGLSAALRELVHETVDRALQRRAER